MKRSRHRDAVPRLTGRRQKSRARADRRRLEIVAFEQWQRSARSR